MFDKCTDSKHTAVEHTTHTTLVLYYKTPKMLRFSPLSLYRILQISQYPDMFLLDKSTPRPLWWFQLNFVALHFAPSPSWPNICGVSEMATNELPPTTASLPHTLPITNTKYVLALVNMVVLKDSTKASGAPSPIDRRFRVCKPPLLCVQVESSSESRKLTRWSGPQYFMIFGTVSLCKIPL